MQEISRKTPTGLPDPTEVGVNEFKKSGATRTRILEAAIECLATIGYHATSTTTVAKYAGLTRAAMLYHFPNRLALIEAVVHYVTRRRVEMQDEAHKGVSKDNYYRERSIELQWALLKSREFWAFSELAMASRTDLDLQAIFKPAMESYDLARREMAQYLAQDEVRDDPGFELRRDIGRFALEGLAQQDGITFDKEKRMSEFKWFLKLLFDSEYSGPLVDKALAMAAEERASKK